MVEEGSLVDIGFVCRCHGVVGGGWWCNIGDLTRAFTSKVNMSLLINQQISNALEKYDSKITGQTYFNI